MKVSLTITDDLIDKIKAYTNSSNVTEAVNYALKDCLLIYKKRELIDKIKEIQKSAN